MTHCLRLHRNIVGRQISRRALPDDLFQILSSQQGQDSQNLFIALFHSISRRDGVFIEKRRGVDPADCAFIFRSDKIGERKLVVNLIESVRIHDHIDWSCRPGETGDHRRIIPFCRRKLFRSGKTSCKHPVFSPFPWYNPSGALRRYCFPSFSHLYCISCDTGERNVRMPVFMSGHWCQLQEGSYHAV